MKTTSLIAAAWLATITVAAQAAEVIKPQIGEPLRDASVTCAPDGTYYLTGTRAKIKHLTMKEEQDSIGPDGKLDFLSNNGVKLWSSKDLKSWKDEGLIYDLMQRQTWHDYLVHFYAMPDRPFAADAIRGIVAPRLQVINGEFFLTVSSCGHDVRWLRAASPKGPYKDGNESEVKGYSNPLTQSRGPGNGAFFTDSDGKNYLIWGPGYLAPLNEKKTAIVQKDAQLLLAKVAGYPSADWCAAQFEPQGASLYLHENRYILTWAAFTDTAGYKRLDSFYAVADTLDGPFSEPKTLIVGSGPVELFDGGQQELMASCSMDDQPVLVPIDVKGAILAAASVNVANQAKARRAGSPDMFDYAHSKPSGTRGIKNETTGRHKLVPVLDLPLSDISLCRGNDGTYYLTGTVASKGKNGTADFENNDGVYLWKSADLDTWLPLGKVWDIDTATSPSAGKDGTPWQKQYRIPGDNPIRTDFCRGVTSPEIHFFNNSFYIAYSMNGRGTGILKSKTGKPEGPYEDLGRLTAMGEAPSLFVDEGEKAYWLWGKGLQVAALTPDLTRIQTPVKDVFLSLGAVPPTMANMETADVWDLTGPSMFTALNPKDKDKRRRYYLTFSAITQVNERANRDTVLVEADGIFGPCTLPIRMIPHGGQTSVVNDGKGQLFAGFSGADPLATFRERPGIVTMEWYPMEGRYWPRMVAADYHTSCGPWSELTTPKGLEDIGLVDVHVFHAPDGYYYFSCSPQGMPKYVTSAGGLHYWKAKQLQGPWEHMGQLYTMEQMRDDPNWPEIKSDKDISWNKSTLAWEPAMAFAKDTYWISVWFGGPGWGKDVCGKKSIGALLKSTSGKPEGPYKFHSEWSHDWQGLIVDGGNIYGQSGAQILWRMNDDLTGQDMELTDYQGNKVKANGYPARAIALRSDDGRLLSEDCGYQMVVLDGTYIFFGLGGHTTYDMKVSWAKDIRGPYHQMGIVPGLGNCPIVKNTDGKWMTAFPQCGSEKFLHPFSNGRAFMYEVRIDLNGQKPSLWPVHWIEHLDQSIYQ